jgi:lipopolysaccharide/colanic/teichoic acid biosynthesis glycosyltransferase
MTKRLFDVVVGLVLCAFAAPIIVAGALATMLALRTTSPFFSQTRLGYRDKDLRFPKLRTMPASMPAYALKTAMSFDHLPRVSRFLRSMHIDELPQLFLVVRGELSLVGPRPKMPDDVEPVDAMYSRTRRQVPQGCTGLWQISVDKSNLPGDHPEYDFFYVANHSLRLDAWILWRTLTHALRLTNLVTLEDVPTWARRTTRTHTPERVLDLATIPSEATTLLRVNAQ